MRCDKGFGKWLKNAEEELGQAAAIVERSDIRDKGGVEDEYTKRAGSSESLRGVETGQRELQEFRATVSARFAAGLKAFVELASSKLLPDFEQVCAGDHPDQEEMAKLAVEPTVQLLPALAPKLKAYMEVAAQCGAATDAGEAVHTRIRVYLGGGPRSGHAVRHGQPRQRADAGCPCRDRPQAEVLGHLG